MFRAAYSEVFARSPVVGCTGANSTVRIEGNPLSKSACTPPQRSQDSVDVVLWVTRYRNAMFASCLLSL